MNTARQLGEEYPSQDRAESGDDRHPHPCQLGAYDCQPQQPQDHVNRYERWPDQTFARQH